MADPGYFYGVYIHRYERSTMGGIRYWAWCFGDILYADTLDSMRSLIRAHPNVKVRRRVGL